MLEVSHLALTLTYTGARPYAELTHNTLPCAYGFARGEARDDVPDSFIEAIIQPMIANGATMWKVSESAEVAEEKTKAMLDAVEPVVEEAAEEAPVVTEQSQAMIDAVESMLIPPFSESMSRAQMMSWCRSNGIATTTKDTKATLTEKASAYLAGVE
tara:strand:+ start:723 stop:1193 length:471 start_codon:yes stop_codon:yes gene_type:complete